MDFCWWWRVLPVGGGGGLCCVWWGFVEGFEVFFLGVFLRFLDLEFVGGLVIVVVVYGSGCSGGSWFLVGGDYHGAVCLYIVGF